MRKFTCILLALALMLTLSACTVGPLIATATPVPTAEPTPEPTKESTYAEDVTWPTEGAAALAPAFPIQLDTMNTEGDTFIFGSFTEGDPKIITNYIAALKEAGFTTIVEESETLFSATHEQSDGLLKVQLWYDSGMGTIQVIDDRKQE